MRVNAVRAVAVAAVIMVVTGCSEGLGRMDDALPVALRITTTPTTVEIDAPGWLADVSEIYVCAKPPPTLPDSTTDRRGWRPGGDCHDFGRHPSGDGLAVSLQVADMAGPKWSTFEAASDWYVLVLDLDGDLVTSAVRSQFHAPPLVAPS
jgi:hypothetical protein